MRPTTSPTDPDSRLELEPKLVDGEQAPPNSAPIARKSRLEAHPRGDRLTQIRAINDEAKTLLAVESAPKWKWKLSDRAAILLWSMAGVLFVMGTPAAYWAITAWRAGFNSPTFQGVRGQNGRPVVATTATYPQPGQANPAQPFRNVDVDLDDLKSDDDGVRLLAIEDLSKHVLGQQTMRPNIAVFLSVLDDKDARVRERAARTLGEVTARWPWQAPPFEVGPIVDGLSMMLIKEKDPSAAVSAAISLARYMPTNGSIKALEFHLNDEDPNSRSAAGIALVRLGEGDLAVEAVADVWDAEHSRYRGDHARIEQLIPIIGARIGSFPENGRVTRTAVILKGLRNKNRTVRVACARGFAAIGRDEYDTAPVVSALGALVDEANSLDEESAFKMLVHLADADENDDALAVLKRLSRSHSNLFLRKSAGEALDTIKAKRKSD